jgi:predicted nuclease of predicted toxin-antitoxin system
MKILLDENIDIRFKALFPAEIYEVYTVRDMQWNGIKNGALLKLLKEHQFDCWIVVDKNIPYQQNLSTLPCLIIVLDVIRNTLKHISPLIPSVLDVLKDSTERKVIVIPEVTPEKS